jgi:hypothetical protein
LSLRSQTWQGGGNRSSVDVAARDCAALGLVPHIPFDETDPVALVQLLSWMPLLLVPVFVTQR